MKKIIPTFISIFMLLLGWQILAWTVKIPDLVPSVPILLKTLAELFVSAAFYQSVIATITRGLAGMLLSLLSAGGISLLFARNKYLYELFRPILAIMRSIPVVSFILLALIFLNPESIPLMIAFLTMFPLLTENLTNGICSQRQELMVMARLFRIGRWNQATQIIYPQLKPFLYSGLASASGFGWRAIIMGEVLSQCSLGIGSEMKRAQTFIAVPELMAWTLVAIFISFIFDKGINKLGEQRIPVYYDKKESTSLPESQSEDIKINDVSFRYKDTVGISHLSTTFYGGKIYGISAPSGTGKTTLLNLINGSLQPDQGEIIIYTVGIASVFEEPELLKQLTVMENVALPLASLLDKPHAVQRAIQLLDMVELTSFANRHPGELSFGQQQRTAIARALAFPSAFLLMDEPFKGLDNALSKRIIKRILQKQSNHKQTILFTSHNPEELKLLADEIICL